jgi:putative ABC transport system permease protein
MLGYYLDLARRSFRRNVALTILMVLAIAFGVGASMTTLTVLRLLATDPIPGHSHDLYYVQLEPRKALGYMLGEEPPSQSTRGDAEALVRAGKADRQALMTGGSVAIESERPDLPPFLEDTRYTSADFFAMFRVPFIAGGGWSAADDQADAHVIVIARALAEKLFGTTQVVGRSMRVDGTPLRIVGVTDDWNPRPHFFDLNTADYGNSELVFIPFSTSRELKLRRNGDMDCWDVSPDPEAPEASCVWVQMWVELDSADKVAAYRDYLVSYSADQQRSGRFQRPANIRLRDVIEWLEFNKVVPSDARLQTWIALGFLLVCLLNTVGLLLTKFLRRSSEIGVRRALGASRAAIFTQLLVEAGVIGVAGGALGLALAWLGLWAVRHQPTSYAELAHLDVPMLAATLVLAVASALLAGLLPAWRGCQVAAASQLKAQ